VVVDGTLECQDGAINLLAPPRLAPLRISGQVPSRNFR
jgi:hypothetical protein